MTSGPRWSSLSSRWSPSRAAAAAFLDLGGHGARHHVAARQVLGVRRVALHEALAVLVQEIAALAAHALGDQHAGAGDAGGVELPELHVLERQPGARHHAEAVAGVDERVGRRPVDPPGAAGGQQGRFRLEDAQLAGLHLQRHDADARAVLRIADQVERHPLDEELGVGAHVLLVERVQHGVAGAVGGGAGAHRHLGRCRSSAYGRRRGAGRSCRSPAGRTACPCARARPPPRSRAGTCTRSRPGRRGSRRP